MHVCLASDECPPETAWGGIGTYVAEAARALRMAGHRVTLLSVANDGRDRVTERDGIQIVRFGLPPARLHSDLFRAFAFPWRSALYLRRIRDSANRPDIIEYPDWLGQGMWRTGLNTVIRLHSSAAVLLRRGGLAPTAEYRMIARLEALALRRPSALLATSRRVAVETRAAFRLPPSRDIEVVPCVLDTDVFCPMERRHTSPTVLFVGRLDRAKGALTLFTALSTLVKRFPELRCIVVGPGPGDGGGSATALFKERGDWLTQDPAVARAVTFVGQLPRTALPALYQAASVVVAPSLYESFSYVAVEGMACGRPVVLSDQCGVTEIVEDGVSAAVVPAESPGALSERIAAILTDPVGAEEMGRRARVAVLERCSPNVVARELRDFYERVGAGSY